ncbi:MAG TPA: DUF2017 domain-containing protein [Streptosporangiaceae bacterium]
MPGIGFRAARGGGATAQFSAAEAVLLRGLVSQITELIDDGLPQPGADGGAGPATGLADLTDPAAAAQAAGPAAPDTGPPPTPEATEAAIEEMLGLSSSSRKPDDPILARLFPDGYSDDDQASGEFRRYTERGLRSGKMAAAQTVLDTLPEAGGRVQLTGEQAQAWLRALNDIRLALGVQLEVSEDMRAMQERAAQGGPQAAGFWIYDWLSVLQESLVHALW